MTIEEAYNNFVEQLKNIYAEREASNIADWVFESQGIKRLDRITNKQNQLADLTIRKLDDKLKQLLKHTPVQYVLNEAWFYKMKLFVNEHVLIPRPETEELVEWIAEELKIKNEKLKIIEIGTGSGCIAIALKKELPNLNVTTIDISNEALKVAKQNAQTQNAKIEFIQLDFLDEKSWLSLPFFNIIVSNPPYISKSEKSKLDKNVVDYEPHLALFVEDDDPYIFYKKIALFSQIHLIEGGKIYVEVHEEYAERIKEIFRKHQLKSEIKKDMYGKERMIKAYK